MKRSSLLACLLALCFALLSEQAQALTLGRLRVMSPLGQPLNAEIDIPDINQEEASSLRIAIASAEAFKSAGLEYNPSIANIVITGKRRADGRAYLELKSGNVVNEPFLDLVLDISWATGRMVRDYTLLFDPPVGNISAATGVVNPTLPIASAAPAVSPTISAATNTNVPNISVGGSASQSTGNQSIGNISVRTGGAVAAAAVPAISARTAKATKVAKGAAGKKSLTVKKGDTAALLATAEKPEGVSLDQMLVAMLKANPDAFIDGNVNRLKSGVVLEIPTDEDIKSVNAQDAKSSLQVQSRNFDEYRRNLAGNVVSTAADSAKRETSGKLSAKVEDKKANAAPPDRLTLAKPDSTVKPSIEDKIASDRAASDAAGRRAELEKNIADLGKIAAPTAPTTPAVATGTPSALPPPPPPPGPAQADTSKDPLATPSGEATSGAAAIPTAKLPTAAVPSGAPVAGSWINQLLSNTLLPWIAGALALALLAVAWLRVRRRKNASDTMQSPHTQDFESNQQAATQTVFGAMGAHQVNTQQEAMSSTMVYSPSQFASGTGDVDPIAEADVYLAYNRDVQAEEILKEAKRTTPKRTDVYVKLLEIYVKRHDVESFDSTAQELHMVCDGEGADWSRTRELAREIQSNSPLFAVTGASFAATEAPKINSAYNNNSLSFTPSVQIQPQAPIAPAATTASSHLIDFDLSALTLDLPQTPASNVQAAVYKQGHPVSENAKLALAEEYLAIGDKAGARGLIQEVIAQEANAEIVNHAHQMLARIG